MHGGLVVFVWVRDSPLFLSTLLLFIALMAAPVPAAGGGGAPAPVPPAPVAPAVPHVFNRVTIPGHDNELDYVAVDSNANIIKGLPS